MADVEPQRMVCLGIVTAPRGVRGEVRIRSFTARPEDVAAYGDLYDAAGERCLRVRACGMVRGAVIARVEGIDDRDAAERLRGLRLHVRRDALPAPDDEEYYHADLVGLSAELVADDGEASPRALGRVVAVDDFGAGPVLEIAAEDGPAILVPFTRAVVPVVDLAAGRIVVAAVPGLLADVREAIEQPAPPAGG